MAARRGKKPAAPPPIESLDPAPVTLLFGADEYPVTTNARALVDRLMPADEQALGLELIEGHEATTAAAAADVIKRGMDGLQTVGLFGGRKVVWLRDCAFLGEGKVAQWTDTRAAIDRLVDLLKGGLPPDVQLVISARTLDKRSSLYRVCNDLGHALEYTLPDRAYEAEALAQQKVTGLMAKAGLSASPDVVERFVAKVGTDTRLLGQEVEKLALYLGDRTTVEADDIRAIVSPGREASAWDFEDALGMRNLADAIAMLRQLIFQGENPMGLIFRMEARFRDLMAIKECLHQQWCKVVGEGTFVQLRWENEAEAEPACAQLQRDPRAMNPYRGGRLARQAQCYSRRELMHTHRELVEAHETLVSSTLPWPLILELLIIRVIGPS